MELPFYVYTVSNCGDFSPLGSVHVTAVGVPGDHTFTPYVWNYFDNCRSAAAGPLDSSDQFTSRSK